MGTKTYVSVAMNNLNSSNPDFKWQNLSCLEVACANWQHIMQGFHLQETQMGGHGTTFRNWIHWARNYKWKNYHREEIEEVVPAEALEQTWNEMIEWAEPQVAASVELSEEQMGGFIENNYGFPSGTEEIENGSVTVTGVMPDGTLKEVTIQGRAKINHKYKIINSYSGSYSSPELGEAYIWENYEEYLKDSDYIKLYILSDGEKQGYQVISGDQLSEATDDPDKPNHVEGSYKDVWLQFGNTFEEPHTDNNGDEVITDIFNAEESVYVEVESNVPKCSKYFAMWGYLYDTVELDAKQYKISSEGYLELDSSGQPTKLQEDEEEDTSTGSDDGEEEEKPEREWTVIKVPFELEVETYNGTEKIEIESEINIANVKGFGYIQDLKTAANDPNIGSSLDPDIENVDSMMPPIVCFRHDKGWIHEDYRDGWWIRNVYACKKVSTDKNYYPDLFDNLKDSITNGDVAWVYLIYGVPANYAQMHCGAHYCLQFFKQLTIPNWQQYTHGAVGQAKGKRVVYTCHAYRFNMHFRFEIHTREYRCGVGKCPCVNHSPRGGEAGIVQWNGCYTLWNQCRDDAWELIMLEGNGIYTAFHPVKNGQGHGFDGGANWLKPMWDEEDGVQIQRQYSETIIPFMWQIGKNIPYTDWTNLYQYSANVGCSAYKVVETKWYESGLFAIIIVIIIIVITVIISYFCPPAGAAMSSQMGATIAATVGGSALFWTAVVTVAISVAVSIAVNAILTPVLKSVFGEEIGAILGAVVAIVVSVYLNGGQGVQDVMNEFMKPSTWMQLGNAWLEGKKEAMQKEVQEAQQKYNTEMAKLQRESRKIAKQEAELGRPNEYFLAQVQGRTYGATTKDPIINYTAENPENFFYRTYDGWVNFAENIIAAMEEMCPMFLQNMSTPAGIFGQNETNTALA